MNIKSTKPVSVSQAKEILTTRKEQGELGYEQSQAVDSSGRFAIIDSDKTRKIIDAIKNDKISEELAVKIADIRPDNVATLKAILVKDRIELSDEEASVIIKELA
jgi:DNA-directed RNA polymerase subunit F